MRNKPKSSGSDKRGRQGEGGGKPPFEPTAADRIKVKSLAAYGIPPEAIAKGVNNPRTGEPIGIDTLHRAFAEEIATGRLEIVFEVGNTLKAIALGRPAEYDKRGKLLRAERAPDLNACTLLMRFCAGWKEPKLGAPGEGGDDRGQVVGVIYAPAPFAKL
jgi:hypothetical protein